MKPAANRATIAAARGRAAIVALDGYPTPPLGPRALARGMHFCPGMPDTFDELAGPLIRHALAAIVFAALLVGCGGAERAAPPKLNVIPKGEVTSTMWQLAGFVNELDALMRDTPPPVDSRDVVLLLQQMERAAYRLNKPDARTTHPLIAQNSDEFLAGVIRAREAAEREPPNYYLAGAITGGCIYCHDPEGGIW